MVDANGWEEGVQEEEGVQKEEEKKERQEVGQGEMIKTRLDGNNITIIISCTLYYSEAMGMYLLGKYSNLFLDKSNTCNRSFKTEIDSGRTMSAFSGQLRIRI